MTADLLADLDAGRATPTPERITMALDLPAAPGAVGPLEGPGVDEFCGVVEPTVDLWETGEVVPSSAELAALAELTGYPVPFFFLPAPDLDLADAWFCVSGGPRHGCYRGDDPALETALALADLGDPDRPGRVARPVPPPPRSTRARVTVTAGPLPECAGCAAPMRRATWTRQGGRCRACVPTS